MAKNPFNLVLRFFLELVILFAIGFWAWQTQEGGYRYFLVVALPLAAAAVWSIFRTPSDHGKGLVVVPGFIRLFLEAILFVAGWWCLKNSGQDEWALWFIVISLLHYIISYDRVIFLLKH